MRAMHLIHRQSQVLVNVINERKDRIAFKIKVKVLQHVETHLEAPLMREWP